MSKDIRSFFTRLGEKKPNQTNSQSPSIKKRKAVKLLSDEDEGTNVEKTPKEKKPQHHKTKTNKKRRILDSDEEIEATPPPKLNQKLHLKKLVEKPDEIQKRKNTEPLMKSEKSKLQKPVTAGKNLLDKDEFDKSVIDSNEIKLKEEVKHKKINGKSSTASESLESSSAKDNKLQVTKQNRTSKSPKQKCSPLKSPEKVKVKEEKKCTTPNKTTKKIKNEDDELLFEDSFEKKSPQTKHKSKSDHELSGLSDEDRHEKKRLAAVLYQKYKNRQSVINHGCKEIPKGKPNCLAGLSFVVTGILESMEREEANTLIRELGGKVSTTVGKRLNYMVVGEEAGPKKLATAEELGIKILSEDGLFDLIREKSGEKGITKKNSMEKEEEVKELVPVSKEKPNLKKHIKDDEETVPEKKKKVSPRKTKGVTETEHFKSPIKKSSQESEISEVDESTENLSWVDKYKPKELKQIIGQQGPASNIVKLKNWLSKWHSNHDGKKKLQKPNPWAKNDDGSYYKAVLLSGPPGVGKTSTANLICKELGFDKVEFNASDTRSKKLLKEEVSELLSNKSLYGYFHGEDVKASKKHVLIMDEVDGMAGNEDRGGVQELINLIKSSSVPIICMCNDRNHPKMRSLVNYCYDLRFNRPRLEQIKGPMMTICFKEKLSLPAVKIEEIISATNHDIRQTINYLAMISSGKDLNLESNKNQTAKKDLKLGPWEVVRKVFSIDEHKHMSLNEKSDLFFNDYSLGPLFVQQNYLSVMPRVPKNQVPQQVAKAADSLSVGDLIEKKIRSNSAWVLLPLQAMFSSVLPGEYMAGHFTGQINFPAWLGKNSRANKRSRIAQEIHNHTRIRTSGSRLSVRLDYAPFLLDAIVRPLKDEGVNGVEKSLEVIKEYRLLREDIDSLIELASWPGKKNPMDKVEGKVKAALTRAYNKEILAYSYSNISSVKKKTATEVGGADLEYLEDESEEMANDLNDEEEEDDLENDTLIKIKKKPISKTSSSQPSTSKKDNTKVAGKKAGKSSGAKEKKK